MYLTLPNCTFKNGPKSSFYSTYILSQKRRQGLGRVKNDIVPMRKKKKAVEERNLQVKRRKNVIGKNRESMEGMENYGFHQI